MNGEATRGKTAFQAVSLIQAAPGADVKVTVRHAPGSSESPSSSSSSEEGVTGGGATSGQDVTLTLKRSSSAKNPVSSRMVGRCRLTLG